jgi:hypothetical protein
LNFLAGDTIWEIRETVLASDVVNLDAPATSRLLTKGVHTGPAMNAIEVSDLLVWLQAEQAER